MRRTYKDIKVNNSRNELLVAMTNIDSMRDRALAAFLYLTGCRISEVLGKVKHYYKGKGDTRQWIKDEEIPPLSKKNIDILDDNIILITNVPCLKWRSQVPLRTIPLKISSDKEFIDIFMEYYKTLPLDAVLFPISRQRAWQIINKKLGLYTHFLIHQRCTDLVIRKGFSEAHLKQFRGWKDTRAADYYSHLRWDDLADKM